MLLAERRVFCGSWVGSGVGAAPGGGGADKVPNGDSVGGTEVAVCASSGRLVGGCVWVWRGGSSSWVVETSLGEASCSRGWCEET